MYFIYLVIALFFPASPFDLTPTQTGTCYMLISACYMLGGLLGSIFAKAVHQRLGFAGRMLLPVITFLILAIGNFAIGWTLALNDFWMTFSIILVCAVLRGFVLPGLCFLCVN